LVFILILPILPVISDLDFNITTDALGHVTAADWTTINTREFAHSDLAAINANQHIDWTNTTASLLTTGSITGNITLLSNSVSNIELVDMAANTIQLRNAGTRRQLLVIGFLEKKREVTYVSLMLVI
jgi:hypothetical protein